MLMDPSKHYRAADQQILSEYWTKNAEPDHHFILDSEYMAFLNRCTVSLPYSLAHFEARS